MTEKRFSVNDLDNIQDNNPKGRLYILTERGGVNALCNLINGLDNKTNRLLTENGELKQRNNNQYKQLQQLWSLMETKDWETLTNMVEQMKKDEEQLQKEWGSYSDVE